MEQEATAPRQLCHIHQRYEILDCNFRFDPAKDLKFNVIIMQRYYIYYILNIILVSAKSDSYASQHYEMYIINNCLIFRFQLCPIHDIAMIPLLQTLKSTFLVSETHTYLEVFIVSSTICKEMVVLIHFLVQFCLSAPKEGRYGLMV